MSSHRGLSLSTAVLININVMLGIGVFLNTIELAKRAGALGCVAYAIIGIMMLPLILSMAHLVRLHPQGGFYAYANKEIGTLAGFLSAWGYFTGKLGSGAIVLHTAMLLIQSLIPMLKAIPTLILDVAMIIIFVLLNTLNMQAGAKIQRGFIVCKIIPIFFAIFLGIILFQPTNFVIENFDWTGIPSTIPLVLFAVVGFEVACSLSSKIENPAKNAPKAILISYALVIITVFLYQALFYGVLGEALAEKSSYLEAFPALLQRLIPNNAWLAGVIAKFLHLGLAASALGGSYGTMFSNSWNLYTLGQHNHLFFTKLFTRLNSHAIPVACVVVEGIIYVTYLLVSGGAQVPLQILGALGCVLGYTFSVLGLLYACATKKYPHISTWIPVLGFINCLILIASCVNRMMVEGPISLYILIGLLIFGTVMFFVKQNEKTITADSI